MRRNVDCAKLVGDLPAPEAHLSSERVQLQRIAIRIEDRRVYAIAIP